MNEKLREYIESLFASAPKTVRTVELKEEMLQNLTEKYNDLIREGKSEEAAYNIAVASIGDVSSLIGSARASHVETEGQTKRSAIMVAVAIAMYILCPVPCIIFQNAAGVVLLFVMIAAATGLLIYNGTTKDRYVKQDDTMVEDFREWKQNGRKNQQAMRAINGAIWLVAVCVYLLASYMTGAWHLTWLIFVITGAVCMVVRGIFDLKQA